MLRWALFNSVYSGKKMCFHKTLENVVMENNWRLHLNACEFQMMRCLNLILNYLKLKFKMSIIADAHTAKKEPKIIWFQIISNQFNNALNIFKSVWFSRCNYFYNLTSMMYRLIGVKVDVFSMCTYDVMFFWVLQSTKTLLSPTFIFCRMWAEMQSI